MTKGRSANFAVLLLELCFLKISNDWDDRRQQELKPQQERTWNTNDFCKYCFFTFNFVFKYVDYFLLSHSHPLLCVLRNTFCWRADGTHTSCIHPVLYSEICLGKISKFVKILTFEMQTWPWTDENPWAALWLRMLPCFQLETSDFIAQPFETTYKCSSSTAVQSHMLQFKLLLASVWDRGVYYLCNCFVEKQESTQIDVSANSSARAVINICNISTPRAVF